MSSSVSPGTRAKSKGGSAESQREREESKRARDQPGEETTSKSIWPFFFAFVGIVTSSVVGWILSVGIPGAKICSPSFMRANFSKVGKHPIFSKNKKLARALPMHHEKTTTRIYHFVGRSSESMRELAHLYAEAADTELVGLPATNQMEYYREQLSNCSCPVFYYEVPSGSSLDFSFAHHLKYMYETPDSVNRCLRFIFASKVNPDGQLFETDSDEDVLDIVDIASKTSAFNQDRVHRISIPLAIP